MVQIELGSELEERLQHAADAQGITVDEYVRKSLETGLDAPAVQSEIERRARHVAAVDALSDFGKKHKLTLGPDLTIKDLINEGRR